MLVLTQELLENRSPLRDDWDAIDPAMLLPLVGVRTMSTEFGYLLRHYWTPASELHYRTNIRQVQPDGTVLEIGESHRKTMVRCDADRCVWRQQLTETNDWEQALARLTPPQTEERLCEYDRTNQTYRTRAILGRHFEPENEDDARMQALLALPILTPLLPIPVGFQWHVQTENGYLDFTLESFSQVGSMPVVFVRRKGVLSTDTVYRHGRSEAEHCIVEQEGITAFALDRCVVLEDRIHDRVRDDCDLAGLETWTTTRLMKSIHDENHIVAPLFFQYKTDRGQHYLYDCGTSHIVEIDEAISEIVDDWHVLTDSEIKEKYDNLGEETVRTAIRDLDELRSEGLLADHPPRELSRVERVFTDRREKSLDEFCRTTGTLLVLGITERCNLCCEYCCFSGKFEGQRTHGPKSMSLETAQAAIRFFLENEEAGDGTYPITFYGGEPLLEFGLLRDCVHYGEDLARSLGKTVRFALTTNGTLLTDEVTDFLVEHDFYILVSLDGPKPSHDRYRVFPNGTGSFETVIRRLKRFAKRHPTYKNRGLNMTLAPPLDFDGAAKLVTELFEDYPLTRANIVNTGSECRFPNENAASTRYGCHSKADCKKSVVDGTLDPFRRFEPADRDKLKTLWSACVESLATVGSEQSWQTLPLGMMLFESQLGSYHRRTVLKRPVDRTFCVPCIPGLTRRFCDVDGNYRVCERVDHSKAYILGNVSTGPDAARMDRTMELRRHFGDCGNCPSLKFCDVCYARMPGSDAAQEGFDPLFDLQCRQIRQMTPELLKTYTEIMETNREAFDRNTESDNPRFKKLLFGGPDERPNSKTLYQLKQEVAR